MAVAGAAAAVADVIVTASAARAPKAPEMPHLTTMQRRRPLLPMRAMLATLAKPRATTRVPRIRITKRAAQAPPKAQREQRDLVAGVVAGAAAAAVVASAKTETALLPVAKALWESATCQRLPTRLRRRTGQLQAGSSAHRDLLPSNPA